MRYCLEVSPYASVNVTFWEQVYREVGDRRWRELAKKWGDREVRWTRIAKGACITSPEFEDFASLICWAYELLLNQQLDLSAVELVLKNVPPTGDM